MTASILLISPKYDHNVGQAFRSAALLGADLLTWTGTRVPPDLPRLPREERLNLYRSKTRLAYAPSDLAGFDYTMGSTPVCVEIVPGTQSLYDFAHPEKAVYIFGPEDGSVPKVLRSYCHAFVRIPTADDGMRTPFNLSVAVSLVLQDRLLKMTHEVTRRLTPDDVQRLNSCARCQKMPAPVVFNGIRFCSEDCIERIGDYALDDAVALREKARPFQRVVA